MRSMRLGWILALVVLTNAIPTVAQDTPILPQLPGHIAYIGTDFNVYTLDLQTNGMRALTEDAGIAENNSVQTYAWPTWSTDGRLAYFGTAYSASGQILSTDVYVAGGPSGPEGVLRYEGDDEAFNYAYWAPQNCPNGEGCRDLAVLLSSSSAGGLFVELVRDSTEPSEAVMAGRGAPFYYSWSPDARRMFWHRNNQRLDLYDVEAGEVVETLPELPGAFFAPKWSPVDDRLLYGALNSDGQTTDLLMRASGDTVMLASGLSGTVTFAWSPDGNRVAYADSSGPLQIIDTVTGETLTRSPVTGVLAYFWAPDSRSLAYVTLASTPGSLNVDSGKGGLPAALAQQEPALAWSVLDASTGAARRFTTFNPTPEMVYMLTYFDQFALSHRFWSPDSRYLLYSELSNNNDEPVIAVLDVSRPDTVPLVIAEGLIGVWSFE